MAQTIEITGNTYPVKDQIKALGGRWNAERKTWMVPADRAEEARRLVITAPRQGSSYRPRETSQERLERTYKKKYGWDGVRGSPSYYSSGMYDEES